MQWRGREFRRRVRCFVTGGSTGSSSWSMLRESRRGCCYPICLDG
uniref:Uncharacterized protein n=1 Tax=Rhizophora mucronata TaxID=61149 RepID=A0A2P2Q4K4_RHIMU